MWGARRSILTQNGEILDCKGPSEYKTNAYLLSHQMRVASFSHARVVLNYPFDRAYQMRVA